MTAERLDELRKRISGRVVTPDDSEYDVALVVTEIREGLAKRVG